MFLILVSDLACMRFAVNLSWWWVVLAMGASAAIGFRAGRWSPAHRPGSWR